MGRSKYVLERSGFYTSPEPGPVPALTQGSRRLFGVWLVPTWIFSRPHRCMRPPLLQQGDREVMVGARIGGSARGFLGDTPTGLPSCSFGPCAEPPKLRTRPKHQGTPQTLLLVSQPRPEACGPGGPGGCFRVWIPGPRLAPGTTTLRVLPRPPQAAQEPVPVPQQLGEPRDAPLVWVA